MKDSTAVNNSIYLDYNATSPMKPEVCDAMHNALYLTGNPSSVHQFGRQNQEAMEDARLKIARMIKADPGDLVFTAGGTEANNMALFGAKKTKIITSEIEHPSILKAVELGTDNKSTKQHKETLFLPVDSNGLISLQELDNLLALGTGDTLVSIMLANNEIGVLQPIKEICNISHKYGALVHCDAVQAPGRINIDVHSLDVDMLSLSAHKFGGPKGIGALYIKSETSIDAMVLGGGQERGRRAGTENVPGIIGFGVAADLALEDLARVDQISTIRDRIETELSAIEPRAKIFSKNVDRLPNTCCITMPGVQSEMQVLGLDLAGVAVSAGSACSSGKVEPSHVLKALGEHDSVTGCAIRISLGWGSKEDDADRLIAAWRAFYAGLSS